MSITFIAYGLLATLFIGVLGTPRLSLKARIIIALALLICTSIGTFLFFGETIVTLAGPTPWYGATPYRELLLFLTMVLGMVARYFTLAIEARRTKIRNAGMTASGKRVPLEFDLWEFLYPMLVSVITFGALLPQLENDRLTLANLILGFQTGFFWQTLLSRAEPASVSVSPKPQ